MTKRFLARRNGDILTSENGFVYAWAEGSSVGNNICTLAWLEANRRKFTKAGGLGYPSQEPVHAHHHFFRRQIRSLVATFGDTPAIKPWSSTLSRQ